MPGLPYEEGFDELQNEMFGIVGATAGRGIGGAPGAIVGQKLATGGLRTAPWAPDWTPAVTVVTEGQIVAVVGELHDDGTVTDFETGASADSTSALADVFMRALVENLDGLTDVDLDSALRQLAGEGPINLDGYPDRRLASVVDAGPDTTTSDGKPFYWTPEEAHQNPANWGDRVAPSPPRAAPEPFRNELGRMVGGYDMPAPVEPPSIFDTDVFGEGAIAGMAAAQPAPPPGGLPVTSMPAGRVFDSAAIGESAMAMPLAGVSTPTAVPITASRIAGAVVPGTPVVRSERVAQPPPPRPVGSVAVPFDLSPAGPQHPGDGRLRAAPASEVDDETEDIPEVAEVFGQALLGTVEAVPELAFGAVKQALLGPLYYTPVGVPLVLYELDERSEQHGGGASGTLDALNDMFNPFAGLVHNIEDAVDAYEDGDPRKLANRMFKAAIEVLGMAALLRGGLKDGALGDAAAAEEGAAEGEAAAGELRRTGAGVVADEGVSDRTIPSGTKGGRPTGKPTKIEPQDDSATKLGRQRENEAAKVLAEAGYLVEQNPKVPGIKRPDYRIEGKIFDCHAPTTSAPRNVISTLETKIAKGQADRFVLNLDGSFVTISELQKQLAEHPVIGLKEIIVINGGEIIVIFPW